MVIRAYQDSGMLKIITDEDSDCRYGIKDCNFDFTTVTDMPFSGTKEHTAEWRTDITYYIKCKDRFGNRLMRNRDSIFLSHNSRTMEEWKEIFEKGRMKQIKSEFIKENRSKPDIFPPKAIMVFQKKKLNTVFS